MSANGGNGTGGGTCGGGGGRIALVVTNEGATFAQFDLSNVTAYGGFSAGGRERAAAGTIYTRTAAQGPHEGLLVIDNRNTVGNVSDTLLSPLVTDAEVGDVILRNAAILRIPDGQTLTVYGSWSNSATFASATNGTVAFGGTGTAAVWGSPQTFGNLVTTNTSQSTKTLQFQAGGTNTVVGLLALQDATLRSTEDDTYWYLTLDEVTGSQDVHHVNVRDSNAEGGETIQGGRGSIDAGNNVNWFFEPRGTIFMIR